MSDSSDYFLRHAVKTLAEELPPTVRAALREEFMRDKPQLAAQLRRVIEEAEKLGGPADSVVAWGQQVLGGRR